MHPQTPRDRDRDDPDPSDPDPSDPDPSDPDPSDPDPGDRLEPRYGIGGAPPARSALTLRAVLASLGLVLCVGGALWAATAGGPVWLVVVLVGLAVVAVVDLVVIGRRKARGEPG